MFKPELVLPPLLTGVVLIGVILYSTRRAIRGSRRLSLELNARAEARVAEYLAKNRTELARMQAEAAAYRTDGFDLILTLEDGADAAEVFRRASDLIGALDEFARASGGKGLTLDASQSSAVPGTVTLRLVPSDPSHVTEQRAVVEARSLKIAGVSEVEYAAA